MRTGHVPEQHGAGVRDVVRHSGVLLLSNGESYPLTRNLVVGREPNNHGDVLNGSADVLIPLTQGPSLSRVHALIRLDGWDVHLIDEGSTNGTFVWDEPNHRWLRLAAEPAHRVATR